MKIARIDVDGRPTTGVVVGDELHILDGLDELELLIADARQRERLASRAAATVPLGEARLLAPIQPALIRDFSVFEQHNEGAMMLINGPDATLPDAWYERPAFYFSSPHVVNGPGAPIAAPPDSAMLDLELEVAVIIGRRGANVRAEDASAYIAGYTIFNDWSARDLSMLEARQPFGFHKAKDFANTLGPWIVTADEMEQYRDGDRLDVEMTAFVNGRELGRDTLASMAWSVEQLVEFASRGSVIVPGDVIGSGTCGGGCLFELWGRNQSTDDPPPLQPGDEVRLEVEGIGTLTNPIVARQETAPPVPPASRRRANSA